MEWNLPKSLSYFPIPTTGNDKVTAQEWLGEVTTAMDVANSKATSNLERFKMKNNYKSSPSPTDVERGIMVFLRDEPRSDGMEPCFIGSYTVIERMGQ